MAMPLELPPGAEVDAGRLIALRHQVANFNRRRMPQTGRPGAHASRERGSGLETREIRPFGDGDDFRHVDPSVTARTGKWHVRSFHDDQDRTVLLVADFRRSMLWSTRGRLRSVAAAEALALAGWSALGEGGQAGLLVLLENGTVRERPRSRDAAMVRIAATLATCHREALEAAAAGGPVPDPPLLDALFDQIMRIMPKTGSVCLATGLDDPGPGLENAASALMRRLRLDVCLIRDAIERDPPRRALSYFTADPMRRWGRIAQTGVNAPQVADMLRDAGGSVRVVDADIAPEGFSASPG